MAGRGAVDPAELLGSRREAPRWREPGLPGNEWKLGSAFRLPLWENLLADARERVWCLGFGAAWVQAPQFDCRVAVWVPTLLTGERLALLEQRV